MGDEICEVCGDPLSKDPPTSGRTTIHAACLDDLYEEKQRDEDLWHERMQNEAEGTGE